MVRVLALVVAVMAVLEMSSAAVYKVGDSAGWTTIGNVDYKQWSATKTFQLGDVISELLSPSFPLVNFSLQHELSFKRFSAL